MKRIVTSTAEVRHHMQVAPITNASRKVRMIEKSVPNKAIPMMPAADSLESQHRLTRLTSQASSNPIYPASPSTPTGKTPPTQAYADCCTWLHSPIGQQTADICLTST